MNLYLRHIIFIIVLFCFCKPAAGQQVLAEVDSAHFMIGDHLKLYLKIKDAESVENPEVDLNNLDTMKAFEIIKELDWEKIADSKETFFRKELTITSFDSGYYYLPSLKVSFKNNGNGVSRNTQRIQLAVITPQIDSLSIRPIKTIVAEPLTIEDFYPYLYAIGGFLIFGLGGYFIYKRIKNKPVEEVYVAPQPAHEIALNKLKALESKQLWQTGQLKAYQSELTYIVREYLEKRFDVQALESTTAEIIRDLKQEDISSEHKELLADMFSMADMVKFAKATPPLDIQSQLLDKAEKFVSSTKKVIIAEPDNPPVS